MKRNKFLKINRADVSGLFKLKVNLEESAKIPDVPTDVELIGDSWHFPESVTIYNDKDDYLYAFGSIHTWRTSNLEEWELVK